MNAYNWTVYVDDNFHFMDETERYTEGNFNTYDAAVATCRNIIDSFLLNTKAATADELYDLYESFGEDPWIKGPIPGRKGESFSAFDYARRRCGELRPKTPKARIHCAPSTQTLVRNECAPYVVRLLP